MWCKISSIKGMYGFSAYSRIDLQTKTPRFDYNKEHSFSSGTKGLGSRDKPFAWYFGNPKGRILL